MFEVVKAVDKAGGYVYGQGESLSQPEMMSCAVGAEFDFFKYPLFLFVCCVFCVLESILNQLTVGMQQLRRNILINNGKEKEKGKGRKKKKKKKKS